MICNEFEKLPGVKQRFYGVNFCFTGNFMSADEAEELCTRLKRVGYNAISIHHYERDLCAGAADGTAIDPKRMANGTAEITLPQSVFRKTKVYALAADGARRSEIPIRRLPYSYAFTSDVARDPTSATYLYEIVRE